MRKCNCGYEGYETRDTLTYQFHIFYQNVYLPTVSDGLPYISKWAKMVCCPKCGAVYMVRTGNTFREVE